MLEIKQADENDISIIEDILLDVVHWMYDIGCPQWSVDRVMWNDLKQYYEINDFYILYSNGIPAGCMVIIDYDPMFWDITKGESLYIHKLAVKRQFAGQDYSKILIDFAKTMACKRNINAVRLDCRTDRPKVRALYERNGFVCVKEFKLFGKYDTALYVCNIKKS